MTTRLPGLACALVVAACHGIPSPGRPDPATARPPVMTDHGPVIGHAHGGVTAYLGIPYAAPPVGPLRWRATADHAPWTPPFDAAALGPACAQTAGGIGQHGPFREDCLTLNVWTPPGAGHAAVMVFLHGGAFAHGSSNQPGYDGATIAGKGGVVTVTLNYRLGVFGFLAHPALTAEDAHHSSGDAGLLDQIAALRWVHANIAAFGGDPGNVTVFGESAGGVSTCLLVTSPLAAGLFHRAISESGTCKALVPLHTSDDRTQVGAESVGEAVAHALGCDRQADVLALHARALDRRRSRRGAGRGRASHRARPAQALIGYWTRFARTGDPGGDGALAWPARSATVDAYLELGAAFRAHAGLHASTCDAIESWGARP